jgi:hypothetical protein
MTIYLYVKQCSHCTLKYFGKTIQNPYTYNGSGTYWKNHIKKHNVIPKTLQIWTVEQEETTAFALEFSSINNIVNSKDWANLIVENGVGGLSDESRRKMSEANKGTPKSLGRILSEKTRRKMSESHKGRKPSEETRRKMSEAKMGNTIRLGHKHSEETRRKLCKAMARRLGRGPYV